MDASRGSAGRPPEPKEDESCDYCGWHIFTVGEVEYGHQAACPRKPATAPEPKQHKYVSSPDRGGCVFSVEGHYCGMHRLASVHRAPEPKRECACGCGGECGCSDCEPKQGSEGGASDRDRYAREANKAEAQVRESEDVIIEAERLVGTQDYAVSLANVATTILAARAKEGEKR